MNRELVYPVFLNCTKYCEDIYWETVFEELAYGKTPYGCYITKDFLSCSYKEKEFSYKIDKNKDVSTLYEEVYSILSNKLGILSQKEKIKKRSDFNIIEKNIKESRKDWSKIRKKNVKDYLIENYVIDMKNKYNLTINQSKYLLSIIFIAIVFKVIVTKDILYNNGKIQDINGIDFENKKLIIKKNIYEIEVSFAPSIVLDKKLMSDNWEKYISILRKISNSNK